MLSREEFERVNAALPGLSFADRAGGAPEVPAMLFTKLNRIRALGALPREVLREVEDKLRQLAEL